MPKYFLSRQRPHLRLRLWLSHDLLRVRGVKLGLAQERQVAELELTPKIPEMGTPLGDPTIVRSVVRSLDYSDERGDNVLSVIRPTPPYAERCNP